MSDTTVMRTVSKEQLTLFLRDAGKNPEDSAFAEIFQDLEERTAEDEWEDLAVQFRAAGAEVDFEKASQMKPGMTIPGATTAGPTTPGSSNNITGTTRFPAVPASSPVDEEELAPQGIGAFGGGEPESEQKLDLARPPVNTPVDSRPPPLHLAPDILERQEEEDRVTIPNHPDRNSRNHPQPAPQKPKKGKKRNQLWLFIPAAAVFALIGILIMSVVDNKDQANSAPTAPTVVQTEPTTPVTSPIPAPPAPTEEAPPPEPQPPEPPKEVSNKKATCYFAGLVIRSCEVPEGCERVNPTSSYIHLNCGGEAYRSTKSGAGLNGWQKVTLAKNPS